MTAPATRARPLRPESLAVTPRILVTGVCSAERRRYARLAGIALRRSGRHVVDLPADADPRIAHRSLDDADSICIVDARHALSDLRDEAPLRRAVDAGDARGDVGARARQAATLIEGSTAVVIVNWERVPTVALSILMALVSHLAPTARVRLSRGVPDDLRALDHDSGRPSTPPGERPGWTRALNGAHDPFLTDRRVTTLHYEQLRPLHPERLLSALDTLESGRFGVVVRSMGVCRLATRPHRPARWEQSGSAMWLDPLTGDHGFDDTGQDLAITGIDLNGEAVSHLLDEAALDDRELAAGPLAWLEYADPLPAWPVVTADDGGPGLDR